MEDKKKKPRFSKMKNSLKKGVMKNMDKASKNPDKFIKDSENTNISGDKGIAF